MKKILSAFRYSTEDYPFLMWWKIGFNPKYEAKINEDPQQYIKNLDNLFKQTLQPEIKDEVYYLQINNEKEYLQIESASNEVKDYLLTTHDQEVTKQAENLWKLDNLLKPKSKLDIKFNPLKPNILKQYYKDESAKALEALYKFANANNIRQREIQEREEMEIALKNNQQLQQEVQAEEKRVEDNFETSEPLSKYEAEELLRLQQMSKKELAKLYSEQVEKTTKIVRGGIAQETKQNRSIEGGKKVDEYVIEQLLENNQRGIEQEPLSIIEDDVDAARKLTEQWVKEMEVLLENYPDKSFNFKRLYVDTIEPHTRTEFHKEYKELFQKN